MITNRICLLIALACLLSLPAFSMPLSAILEKDQLSVTVDGKLFTAYKFAATQKYPYFFPVNGPASGTSVTTETSEPYPHHHSLFFGCDRVNGGNYWQDANGRGQILSQGPKIEEAKGERISFIDECLWKQPDQEPIIRDTRRVTITAPDATHCIIDFEISLEPLVDITIEKTNHSLFSARMIPELNVTSGGTLINAEGASTEKGTFGVKSPWCDYFGTRNGVTEGLAIFQNPANRWYPAPWFTRDYGFFSPTPMYWLEGDKLELPKGEKLPLKYRVIVHAGDTKTANIADLFQQYSNTAKP
ncbi:MAG TPA: PmoA family protein [Candidatus Hydrogenedentes bacterium]|nr:PmoA family protein [Candidatus Hydrogenedentota bacterium]